MQPAAAPTGAPLEATETRPALSRLDLPATLLVIAVLELILHRWGARLFFPGLLAHLNPAARVLQVAGQFAFFATGTLGLLTLLYLAGAVAVRRDQFPGALRAAWAAAAVYLAGALGAALVMKGVSEALALHARGALVALSAVALVAVLVGRAEGRAKVGALCLVLPLWLASYAAFASRFPGLAPQADLSGLPTHALRLGESAVVAIAIISFLCFMPVVRARRAGGFGPLLLATAIAAGAAVLSARRFDLTVRASVFAVGIDLPFSFGLRALYLAALFSLALTILSLIAERGPARATGVGLALFCVAGYIGQHPVHLALAAIGVSVIALGVTLAGEGAATAEPGAGAPPAPPIGDAAWRTFVGGVRHALTGPSGPPAEAVIVEGDEGTITRVRGDRAGRPVTVRALSRRGVLTEIELTVGVAPESPPALSLHPRGLGSGRLGPAAADGISRITGDPRFDERFKLRGRAEAIDLLDARVRARLLALWGWVGVWPQGAAASFRTAGRADALDLVIPAAAVGRGDPAALEPLLAIADLLGELAGRARSG
ncbi:MAG TPA: hypothetical protein VGQ83_04960 [Polyangia bacterium]|jgi:hypothetical protein